MPARSDCTAMRSTRLLSFVTTVPFRWQSLRQPLRKPEADQRNHERKHRYSEGELPALPQTGEPFVEAHDIHGGLAAQAFDLKLIGARVCIFDFRLFAGTIRGEPVNQRRADQAGHEDDYASVEDALVQWQATFIRGRPLMKRTGLFFGIHFRICTKSHAYLRINARSLRPNGALDLWKARRACPCVA